MVLISWWTEAAVFGNALAIFRVELRVSIAVRSILLTETAIVMGRAVCAFNADAMFEDFRE